MRKTKEINREIQEMIQTYQQQRLKQLEKTRAERERKRKEQEKIEMQGMNIFHRLWKRAYRKRTLEEIIDDICIRM